VRGRYDGTRRTPYNEIECGDHYSRAMAGWSLLQACTGSFADVIDGRFVVGHRDGRAPLLAGTAWGRTTIAADAVSLEILGGSYRLQVIGVRARDDRTSTAPREVRLDGRRIDVDIDYGPDQIDIRPRSEVELRTGSCLQVVW
jgi:hypothetical protein